MIFRDSSELKIRTLNSFGLKQKSGTVPNLSKKLSQRMIFRDSSGLKIRTLNSFGLKQKSGTVLNVSKEIVPKNDLS